MSLRCESISFSYGKKEVLKDLSFSAPDGSVMYLAGNNGVGKTTLIQLAVGLLPIQKGKITYDGKDFQQVRTQVSVAFDTTPLYPNMSVKDNLSVLYDLKTDEEVSTFFSDMNIDSWLMKRHSRKLSYGQKHRIGIAGALLTDKKYIFLDEPDLGVDPDAWDVISRKIIERKNNGSIILITGQHFSNIENIVDRVAVLHNGRCIYEGAKTDFVTEWDRPNRSLRTAFENIIRMKD